MNVVFGNKNIAHIKKGAKALVFIFISIVIIVLLYDFTQTGIDWQGFVEFIISVLLLMYLIEKINITVPGLFEIKTELGEIKRSLSVVAQNISSVKISNKITLPSYYEGPPVDIDLTDSSLSSGTVDAPTQEEVDT